MGQPPVSSPQTFTKIMSSPSPAGTTPVMRRAYLAECTVFPLPFLTEAYEWMAVFSVIFMLLYNAL